MKYWIVIAALLCTACTTRTSLSPPPAPNISKVLRDPCPSLPPLKDKDIDTLAEADKATAIEYYKCKKKHSGTLNVLDNFNKKYKVFLEEYEKTHENK